jgi:hypothetical protein
MDRGAILLQGLRGQLEGWLDTIKRATSATSVSFVTHAQGEFTLRIEWKKDGAVQHFDRMFTRPEVFGASYGHSPMSWRVQRRACDYARDVMRQVLSARGVI